MVFQRPCGTLAESLWRRDAHPRNATISVLVQSGDVRTIAFASHHAFFEAELLCVDELPYRPIINLQPALSEFGDQVA
jgi:hypothetical protein